MLLLPSGELHDEPRPLDCSGSGGGGARSKCADAAASPAADWKESEEILQFLSFFQIEVAAAAGIAVMGCPWAAVRQFVHTEASAAAGMMHERLAGKRLRRNDATRRAHAEPSPEVWSRDGG